MNMLINKKQEKYKLVKNYYTCVNLSVEENHNFYEIDIDNKVFTTDFIEAIAYIMRNNKIVEDYFWNLPVKESFNNNYESTLYWLSGGDSFWENPSFGLSWSDNVELYSEYFSDKIEICFKLEDFKEVRNYIKENLNLDTFYEFALSKNLL